MARSRTRKQRSRPTPARSSRPRPSRRALAVAVLILAGGAATLLALPGDRAWRRLEPGLGRIRWVATRDSPTIEPPLAPEWIRKLHRRGLPWPTDLPVEPPGASFGSGGTVAWFLIQSARPSQELWHLEKQAVRITGSGGETLPWPGGSGSVLVDSGRRLQFLYLGVPGGHSGTGARIRLRLARFDGAVSEEVSLPF